MGSPGDNYHDSALVTRGLTVNIWYYYKLEVFNLSKQTWIIEAGDYFVLLLPAILNLNLNSANLTKSHSPPLPLLVVRSTGLEEYSRSNSICVHSRCRLQIGEWVRLSHFIGSNVLFSAVGEAVVVCYGRNVDCLLVFSFSPQVFQ